MRRAREGSRYAREVRVSPGRYICGVRVSLGRYACGVRVSPGSGESGRPGPDRAGGPRGLREVLPFRSALAGGPSFRSGRVPASLEGERRGVETRWGSGAACVPCEQLLCG